MSEVKSGEDEMSVDETDLKGSQHRKRLAQTAGGRAHVFPVALIVTVHELSEGEPLMNANQRSGTQVGQVSRELFGRPERLSPLADLTRLHDRCH